MEACHRGARHWLDRAMRLIHGGIRHWLGQDDGIASWGHAMGARNTGWIGALGLIREGLPWGHRALAGSGQWDWFMAVCGTGWIGWWDWFMRVFHGGVQRGLDQGNCIDLWGCVMGVCDWIGWWDWLVGLRHGARDTGWIREMGLIHGGMRHWLDRGDGIDSWGHAMGPCDTGWIGAMGLIDGGSRHWLARGDGIDLWGCTTLAGTGRWHWFMGTRHGGARLDRGNGIDLWGHAMGVRHWLDVGDGIKLWGRAMGARNWIGWWNWFVGESHGGTWHWLDPGDGID